jgi:hypothetical protein
MLQKAEQKGKIEGIKICRRAPRVNHLFFADDSLVLMKARTNDAQELKHILDLYEQAAGKKITKKNHQLCSTQIQVKKLGAESNLISIDSEAMSERYLGLPISIGK